LKLSFSERARSHLIAIHTYIDERSPQAAKQIGARIRDAAELLRYFPEAGRQGRSSDTREWVVQGSPYVIVYEIRQPDEIMVLGVFHGAQDREPPPDS
jgi:toxin ParE1/3/4